MRMRLKKAVAALLALTLALTGVQALAATSLSYPFTTTTTEKVNMRASASSSATVLERIESGTEISVLGASGNYYKVSYNDRTGYVLKEYVDVETAVTPVPETAEGYPYETTTKDSVNLREKRSTSSELLKKIPQGAAVTVEGISGSYAKVTYSGITGYCVSDYINLKAIVKATATPKPTAVPIDEESVTLIASGYETVQKGDTGLKVRALQGALIELGFLSGSVDGKFGSGTETGLVAFQQKNSYPATGAADANLQAFLYEGKPLNSKGVKTEVMTLAPLENVTIRKNNMGDQVVTLQTRLKELGYYAGDVTGMCDTATMSAVKAFQKQMGLTADGIAGATTQTVLYGSNALSAGVTPTPTPAPTATPAPTYTVPAATIRSGDTGEDVKTLQRRLKELGYYNGTIDGKFGSGSVKALQSFQTTNGLEADGVAGSGTYKVLFSVTALKAGTTPTPTPSPTPTAAPATPTPTPLTKDNCVTVSLGVTGTAVSNLQARLTELGYYQATVDGTCKAEDVAAIKTFQEKNGLSVDGKAGYDTQSKLYSVSAITYSGAIAGGTVDSYTTLRKGSTGTAVQQLQARLVALGYLAAGADDGKYGTSTSAAIIAFQRANGLVRDGVAGATTQSKLYSATAVSATVVPVATATPAPVTLKQGDSSESVKAMQQRLIALNYLSGSADGVFGVKTFEAIKAFQKANGLTPDGLAGSQTLAKLNSTSAVAATTATVAPGATATPAPTVSSTKPTAAKVKYANWYTTVKAICRAYPYVTVYDFTTGISWQLHMFSLGAHADSEPLTAKDTANMLKAFGGNTWNPKAVWVVFADGSVYMASTHSMPHGVSHRADNDFAGHLCVHFPRTEAQVTAIGTYATSHQKAIDAGWSVTQGMIK